MHIPLVAVYFTSQQEEGRPSPRAATTQLPRRQHHLELSLSSNELLFKTSPPNFLPSSIKALSSPLFSRLVYGSPEFAIPLLFLGKLDFSWLNCLPFCFKS